VLFLLLHGALVTTVRTKFEHHSACLPSSARPSVIWSAYSRSTPIGNPRARRVTLRVGRQPVAEYRVLLIRFDAGIGGEKFSSIFRHQCQRRRRINSTLYSATGWRPTVKVTRLARGLPIGVDLEYADKLAWPRTRRQTSTMMFKFVRTVVTKAPCKSKTTPIMSARTVSALLEQRQSHNRYCFCKRQ